MTDDETYLGDAVYADNDGYMIRLVANKGGPNEQIVWLEPNVYGRLVEYARRVWGTP
jgi:hypothetical protein